MKVVVLNGGKGTRLGLSGIPKPMVPVGGKPLLERIIESCIRSGFQEFLFLNGHLAEVIESHFGDGGRFGARIEHVREQAALGTAGAVRDARAFLQGAFVVIYGDILIDVDLAHFVAAHHAHGGVATLFVHPNDHPQDSDLVETDSAGKVVRFLSKPHPEGALLPNLVSAALYVLEPAAIDHVPEAGASDWGRDVLPAVVASGQPVFAYRSLEYAKDMGTPRRLAQGEADIASDKLGRRSRRKPKPAVFLDRDGVLNTEIDGVFRAEDLELMPNAGAEVRKINAAGIPAICVTNQPGLAKGMMDAAALSRVFAALDTGLALYGAYLDAVYFCPHHPERGWPGEVAELKVECECRKPKPGMLLEAARDHNLDLGKSWLIGDRGVDIMAAHACGAKAVLIDQSGSLASSSRNGAFPDFVARDLGQAVDYVLGRIA